jgi:hypothetical protein
MRDTVFIALTLAFFGLAALFVAACDRIVGPDPASGAVEGGERDVLRAEDELTGSVA